MIPFYVEGIAAKLHVAVENRVPSGLGVIIVPPHEVEALAAAKSLRLLADRLAADGHSVLRFDFPGTGDSLDEESGSDLLGLWSRAVSVAAAQLGKATGVSGIVVVGLRFGALLGAAAAPLVAELAGLVLLDPVTRGRSYVRELVLTAKVIAEGARLDPDATVTDEGVLIGGLLTAKVTLEGLRKLSLANLKVDVPTLVLHRSSARDVPGIVADWTSAHATSEPMTDFDGIGLSPTMATTPLVAFSRAADWIGALPTRPSPPRLVVPPARLTGANFVEDSFVFGPGNRLFGVLCQPARPAASVPGLVIVNAGRNPHTGWARSSVTLARRLAEEGTATLRFDLGGIGDGIDRPGAADHLDELLYVDEQDCELTAAIDLMSNKGFESTTLLGACSGSYLALRVGARDPRVAGIVLVNLQRFVWRAGESVTSAIANHYPMASSYLRKIVDLRAWKRLLSGERKLSPLVGVLLGRAFRRFARNGVSPETVEARALMRAAIDRHATVDFVYSEDDAGLAELSYHFGPRGRDLAAKPLIKFHFFDNCDHDLTPPFARERLFEITRNAIQSSSAIHRCFNTVEENENEPGANEIPRKQSLR